MAESSNSDVRDGQGVFDAYASYYDLLYRDKDYGAEAAYVHGLIQRHNPGARQVLEMGCGTGGHALQLAAHGYQILGVDRSESMVRSACDRAVSATKSHDIRFVMGDLRAYRANRTFDVVLALFHVISYQTSNSDLLAAMNTAAAHLCPGGLFVFDCWYGPGVLADPPVTRVRRLQGDGVTVTRIAEPIQYPNDNRVDVHYEVLVNEAQSLKRIQETHPMRYLFAPEVDLLLHAAGMRRLGLETWMDGGEPELGTWNVCFVAQR
jgi:SAM-dependent methyltransferase